MLEKPAVQLDFVPYQPSEIGSQNDRRAVRTLLLQRLVGASRQASPLVPPRLVQETPLRSKLPATPFWNRSCQTVLNLSHTLYAIVSNGVVFIGISSCGKTDEGKMKNWENIGSHPDTELEQCELSSDWRRHSVNDLLVVSWHISHQILFEVRSDNSFLLGWIFSNQNI